MSSFVVGVLMGTISGFVIGVVFTIGWAMIDRDRKNAGVDLTPYLDEIPDFVPDDWAHTGGTAGAHRAGRCDCTDGF